MYRKMFTKINSTAVTSEKSQIRRNSHHSKKNAEFRTKQPERSGANVKLRYLV